MELKMQDKESNASKKIVLLGLDNSGKTSIVKCLKGVKNLSSFNTPKPTRGHKINRFNTYGADFSIWDFGGQISYRDEFFVNFSEHIKETDKIIFVIDIQDQERYETSLDYLTKLYSALYIGSWTSYFLALEYNIDPTPVEVIEKLKKELG